MQTSMDLRAASTSGWLVAVRRSCALGEVGERSGRGSSRSAMNGKAAGTWPALSPTC
jgi:hypothetical protein